MIKIDTINEGGLLLPMEELLSVKDYSTVVESFNILHNKFMKIRQSSDDEVYCLDLNKYLPAKHFKGWQYI
jgi:hypothetical protein